jgi:dephospho-CoA kinase
MAILNIGLTGGIASGKTAVSDAFAALGVRIVDADLIARDVVAPGTPALAAIYRRFGLALMQADGSLDRAKLRGLVFADASKRVELEAITHPAIREGMLAAAGALPEPAFGYQLIVIPLLRERAQYPWLERVLHVTAPMALRLARLMQRDGIGQERAEAMIAAQASDAERDTIADDTLDNAAGVAQLKQQVQALHEQYVALAAGRPALDEPCD